MRDESDTRTEQSKPKPWGSIFWYFTKATLLGTIVGVIGILSVWQYYRLTGGRNMFIGTNPVKWSWFFNLALIGGTSGALLCQVIWLLRLNKFLRKVRMSREFLECQVLLGQANVKNDTLKSENAQLEIQIGDIGTAENAEAGTFEDTTANLAGAQIMIAELEERNAHLETKLDEARNKNAELTKKVEAFPEDSANNGTLKDDDDAYVFETDVPRNADDFVLDPEVAQEVADLKEHAANLEAQLPSGEPTPS